MPIHKNSDKNGHYYQYGNSGKKYYFTLSDAASQSDAYQKALRQARAIHASKGY